MAMRLGLITCLLLAGVASVSATEGSTEGTGLSATDRQIAAVRERGQAGLDDALADYDRLETRIAVAESNLTAAMNLLNEIDGTPERRAIAAERRAELDRLLSQRAQLRDAIDRIGGQRSCAVSRLYWYTDLDKAKAEAERTGRPILHLRMLGKLTDEFSCANSRFFRTTLYSNQEISRYLRDNFVLHWQSVRPVPRVTIDFGDGRKLERTLTGNSAHYVLASDGRPLDVLPGLYSPARFLAWLQQMKDYHESYADTAETERADSLGTFHTFRRDAILQNWDLDLQRLGEPQAKLVSSRIDSAVAAARAAGQEVPNNEAPNAAVAARMAVGKTAAEAPLLRFANLGGKWMEEGMDDDLWQAVANLHRDEVKLDQASVTVIRQEFPAAVAMKVAISKMRQEDPVLKMVRTFEQSITLDTVRNEYLLHRQIHERFAAGDGVTSDIDALNEWVYAELFLTPSSDPWLGLAPPDVYTALENGGQVVATTAGPSSVREQ